jgi:ribosomal protein L11 methyltransferase
MEKKTLKVNEIAFDIYSDAYVFGDGTHESTQFMLDLMAKCDFKDKSVIDVGTGTGILSVFAKLSGASHVLALDMSAPSLEWCRKNAKRNNVEVDLEINNLTQYIDDKADIILANLPPAEQCENIKTIKKNLNNDGMLIISWRNIIPLEDFNKDFKVIEHIEGKEYDAYILKLIESEE